MLAPSDPHPARRTPWLALGLLLLVSVGASSCITTYLWGGSIEPDDDGDGAAEVRPDIRVAGWEDFFIKIVLTPFTVVLDVCTFPVQAAVFGWEKTHPEDDG